MPRYGTTLPRTLDSLSATALAARWHVLRKAIDALQTQRDRDGGEHFACLGQMRIEEMELEHRLGLYGASTEHIADVVVRHLHAAAERVSA